MGVAPAKRVIQMTKTPRRTLSARRQLDAFSLEKPPADDRLGFGDRTEPERQLGITAIGNASDETAPTSSDDDDARTDAVPNGGQTDPAPNNGDDAISSTARV